MTARPDADDDALAAAADALEAVDRALLVDAGACSGGHRPPLRAALRRLPPAQPARRPGQPALPGRDLGRSRDGVARPPGHLRRARTRDRRATSTAGSSRSRSTSCSAWCNVLSGQGGLTGRLTVRYRKPTPLHASCGCTAWSRPPRRPPHARPRHDPRRRRAHRRSRRPLRPPRAETPSLGAFSRRAVSRAARFDVGEERGVARVRESTGPAMIQSRAGVGVGRERVGHRSPGPPTIVPGDAPEPARPSRAPRGRRASSTTSPPHEHSNGERAAAAHTAAASLGEPLDAAAPTVPTVGLRGRELADTPWVPTDPDRESLVARHAHGVREPGRAGPRSMPNPSPNVSFSSRLSWSPAPDARRRTDRWSAVARSRTSSAVSAARPQRGPDHERADVDPAASPPPPRRATRCSRAPVDRPRRRATGTGGRTRTRRRARPPRPRDGDRQHLVERHGRTTAA